MDRHIDALLQTIDTLRNPGGCPWDRKQTLPDAAGYLLEEAGELLDAAAADDLAGAREELGDLLFMVAFCVRILGERQPVSLEDVAREGTAKLVRRHPHVFGDAHAQNSGESQVLWEEMKAREKRARGEDPARESVLGRLPTSAPPLRRAQALQREAAGVGFDWPEREGVWAKIAEELAELRQAADAADHEAVTHEVGDLLFAIVNLARWLDVPADLALVRANQRFRRRFAAVEAAFDHDPERLREAGLPALEAAWQAAKRGERT